MEEVDRRARRREINRLAAKRSREKGQRRRETLIQEIQHLQSCKCALEGEMGSLVDERGSLVGVLRKYLQSCCDPLALTSSVRMLSFSHRLAALLNWGSADTPSTGSVAPTSLIATPSCNSSNLAPPSSHPVNVSPVVSSHLFFRYIGSRHRLHWFHCYFIFIR